ncbi:MAG: apolipoprotein N-acyltransferase [Proteobacteria bacterium]|nr:apolipoprotein N-acyltransferase [Pseudomonadota bacterium]
MCRAVACAAAISASAGLYGVAFAAPSLAVGLALAPLWWGIQRLKALASAVAMGLWSLAAALAVAPWWAEALARYWDQGAAVAWLAALAANGVLVTPVFVALGAVHAGLRRLPAWAYAPACGAAWVAAEWLRVEALPAVFGVTGNPWGLLGYAPAFGDVLVQVAALGGVYAVSFCLASAGAGLARALALGRVPRRSRAVAAAAGALPLALGLGYGALRLDGAPEVAEGPRVALVQAHVPVESRWNEEHYGLHFETYLRLTRAALVEEGGADLVFWPEGAMTFFLEREPAYLAAIQRTLAVSGAELVAGGPAREDGAGGVRAFNSVFRVAPTGPLVDRYDKRFLVPFAEYQPFGGRGLSRRDFGGVEEYTAGEAQSPLPTAAGPAGVLVCSEMALPALAREHARAGAAYLLGPANDGWVAASGFAAQQLSMLRLRAVETGRPAIRVSGSGPSAVVDAFGRVRARAPARARHVLRAALPAVVGPTAFTRGGQAFPAVCAAVAGVAAVWGGRQAGRKRSADPP